MAGDRVPAALVSGVEIINVRNVNGTAAVAAVTEVSTVTFNPVTILGAATAATVTFTLAGRTVTLTGAAAAGTDRTFTAADIASAMAGITPLATHITVTGGLAGYTTAIGGTINQVAFTSTIPGNVTDLANTGTGQVAGISTVQGVAAVTSTGALLTVNTSNYAGATEFNTVNSLNAVTFDALTNAQSAGIVGNGTIQNGDLTAAYRAGATAATLNIAGGTTAGNVSITGADLTSATINSTGAANTIGTLTGAASTTSTTINATTNLTTGAVTNAGATLNITGAGAVNLSTTALGTGVTKVDASTSTGNITLSTGNTGAGTAAAPGLRVTTNTGADNLDIRASDAADFVSVSTGAGSDTVTIKSVQIAGAATHTLTGGDGIDTLRIDFANTDDTQTVNHSSLITGFETIEVITDAAGAKTATLAMGVNNIAVSNFVWSGHVDDSLIITGAAANSSVTLNNHAAALNVTIGTNTASDAINVNLSSVDATGVTPTAITLTNYETLNLSSAKAATDAATVANTVASITATGVSALNISGTQALTITTAALAANATVTNTATNTVNAKFTSDVRNYIGGTVNDVLTINAGNLVQGNTFAGGTGTDSLTVTAGNSQDMGIVGLTGFETLNLNTQGANVGDFRNVTGLDIIKVSTTTNTDDLTLNRLSADTTLSFGESIDQVVTTIASGTSQKVAFHAVATVTNITLDSSTTSLTVTSDDGNLTADEAMGVFTDIDGTSLASITVLGKDRTDLGTLETTTTSVDASAATGRLTVTASATATSIVGSQAADTITGGAGADNLSGGAGNDTILGGSGNDIIDGGAGNDQLTAGDGADSITGGAGDDTIQGDAGSDTIDGGAGIDTIGLGAGSDVLVFTSHGAANADTISDYSVADDSIQLSLAAFAGLTGTVGQTLDASAFHSSNDGTATSAAHRIIYDADGGQLHFDADGSGAGAAVLIGTFSNHATLGVMAATEFTIIA